MKTKLHSFKQWLQVSAFFSIVLLGPFVSGQDQAQPSLTSTTALTVSPDLGTLSPGTVITLTAKVYAAGMPVPRGVVRFCDADAASCEGSALIRKAQLTADGTASIKLRLGAGVYNVRAVFAGTPNTAIPVAFSSSPTAQLKVASTKTNSL